MTPKEKANELVEKMIIASDEESERIGKECALICVDEIIELTKINKPIWSRNTLQTKFIYSEYWLEVKQEINKL